MAQVDLWGEEAVYCPPRGDVEAQLQRKRTPRTPRTPRRGILHIANPAENPMVTTYGAGPDGAACGTCVHFQREHHHDYNYSKCRLRGATHGPGTDHRVRWPACRFYVEAPASLADAAAAIGTGHTMPAGWYNGLLRPSVLSDANSCRCSHCGRLLGFTRGVVTYGIRDRGEFERECARCPQAARH